MPTKAPRIAIMTNCSATNSQPPLADIRNMPVDITMREARDWWCDELDKFKDQALTARDLYRGMGFMTLAKILNDFPIKESYIISGGTGLMKLDDLIVPYDFSGHPKDTANIHQHVTKEPFVPTIWWKILNQRRVGKDYPVADVVNDPSVDVVIIAVSKRFLRWITDEALQFKDPSKVKILISRSSMGGQMAHMRQMCIGFDRSNLVELPGNRNDGTHRALYTLLRATKDSSWQLRKSPTELQNLFPTVDGVSVSGVSIREYLEGNKHLLTLSIEDAYRAVKNALGPSGGIQGFSGIFRSMRGDKIDISDEDLDEGVKALTGLAFLSKAKVVDGDEEVEKSLGVLKIFVESLKKVAPSTVFSPQDITQWLATYPVTHGYHQVSLFKSMHKLSGLLRTNTVILGLESVDVVGTSKAHFRIRREQ